MEKKIWIPIESDPQTFTSFSHALGLSPSLSWQDVLSLSDPDLLSLVPRPALALVFIHPHEPPYLDLRTPTDVNYEGGDQEAVWWCQQIIGHACGTMAILHSACNIDKALIEPNTFLSRLIKNTTPLSPAPRAQYLHDSEELETLHSKAAHGGQSRVPDPSEPVPLAFICFVKGKDGCLYELSGESQYIGPTDLGKLAEDEDVLSEEAIKIGVGRFLNQGEGEGELRFSLLALVKEE